MKRTLRVVIALSAVAVYLLALRYVVPSSQPYFIFGIGIIGLVAWLVGTIPGMLTALILFPLTHYIYQQFTLSTSYLSFASSLPYLAIQTFAALTLGHFRNEKHKLTQKIELLSDSNEHLQQSLLQVQELGGVHNLCSECKAIQDNEGNWRAIDLYLKDQTKMEFSHCMCPECAQHFHDRPIQNVST